MATPPGMGQDNRSQNGPLSREERIDGGRKSSGGGVVRREVSHKAEAKFQGLVPNRRRLGPVGVAMPADDRGWTRGRQGSFLSL